MIGYITKLYHEISYINAITVFKVIINPIITFIFLERNFIHFFILSFSFVLYHVIYTAKSKHIFVQNIRQSRCLEISKRFVTKS